MKKRNLFVRLSKSQGFRKEYHHPVVIAWQPQYTVEQFYLSSIYSQIDNTQAVKDYLEILIKVALLYRLSFHSEL